MGTLRRRCATVPQPSELRLGVVRAVSRGTAVLDGVHVVQGEGGFGDFVPHFYHGKCHWFADGEMFPIRIENLTTFPFGKPLESPIRGLFGDICTFQINVGVYEKLAKSGACSTTT